MIRVRLPLKKQLPDLVILPAHDPTAATRLLGCRPGETAMRTFENTVTI